MVLAVKAEWRIECIFDGITDGARERIAPGQLFIGVGQRGFGVLINTNAPSRGAYAVARDGHRVEMHSESTMAYFSKWRIVTGNQKDPFVICEVESPGWGD